MDVDFAHRLDVGLGRVLDGHFGLGLGHCPAFLLAFVFIVLFRGPRAFAQGDDDTACHARSAPRPPLGH